MRLIALESLADHAALAADPVNAATRMPADDLRWHAPDEHWALVDGRVLLARCSVWWRSVAHLDGQRIGAIGHYAAVDAASADRLLERACARLRQAGCTLAVGPLDGNTWRRYRLVTTSTGEPPFALEPHNPEEWPRHFEAAGFHVLAGYRSAMVSNLQAEPERPTSDRFSIRALNPARLAAELHLLYRLSTASFRDNFLYSPIPEAEFTRHYTSVLPAIDASLVLVADADGEPAGFVFGLPDALEARRAPDGRSRTLVVKTLAVAPPYRGQGLARLLIDRLTAAAVQLGYTRAIHALMHDGNVSQHISGSARTIRRYALLARPL